MYITWNHVSGEISHCWYIELWTVLAVFCITIPKKCLLFQVCKSPSHSVDISLLILFVCVLHAAWEMVVYKVIFSKVMFFDVMKWYCCSFSHCMLIIIVFMPDSLNEVIHLKNRHRWVCGKCLYCLFSGDVKNVCQCVFVWKKWKRRCTLTQTARTDFCNKVKAIPGVWDKICLLWETLWQGQSNLLASRTVHYKHFLSFLSLLCR